MIHATEIPLTGAKLFHCFHGTIAVTLPTHHMFRLSNETTLTTNI